MVLQTSVAVLMCFLLVPIPEVDGGVTVSYQFHSFSCNGRDSDGDCCDLACTCEPRFTFCFDHVYGSNSIVECPFGHFTTHHFNGNTFEFNQHDLNGTPNPIALHLDSWPEGGIKMKVRVMDDDQFTSDDNIDWYYESWNGPIHSWTDDVEAERFYYYGVRQMTDHTSLVVFISAQCDAYYYGGSCDVYCPTEDYNSRTNLCETQVLGGADRPVIIPQTDAGSGAVLGYQESGVSGLIIGLICAIFVAILVVVVVLALFYRYRRNVKRKTQGMNTDQHSQFDNPVYGGTPVTAMNCGVQAGGGNLVHGKVAQPPPYVKGNEYNAQLERERRDQHTSVSCGQGGGHSSAGAELTYDYSNMPLPAKVRY